MRGLLEKSAIDTQENSGPYHQLVTAGIGLTSGVTGGATCVFVGQPLDTVKVKLQTNPTAYKNALQCMKFTYLGEGIRGLYAGTVPSLAANVAENAVLFCAYGLCQNIVLKIRTKQEISELTPLDNAFSGSLAAVFSSVALCPTELVKCRLQADSREFLTSMENRKLPKRIGPLIVIKNILAEEGFKGFFRGFVPTVAREMPGYFFLFGSYELTKSLLTPQGEKKEELGPFKTVLCGGVGGIFFWISIFPLDLLKSKAQVSDRSEHLWKMTQEILQREGIRGLYKGLGPTLVRTFPATGAMFLAVEYTKRFLHYILD